jgi:hypothetical protein
VKFSRTLKYSEMEDETIQHESFGLISLNRFSGGARPLFGSSIQHKQCVQLTISQAEVHRSLNRDSYYDTVEIIEVEMSQTQFAEAITTLNHGGGVPCTIKRIKGRTIASPPIVNERQRIQDEFERDCKEIAHDLDASIRRVSEILAKPSISKADRKLITDALSTAKMRLANNLPFVHGQFDEAMDKTVTQAKGEIEAFFTNALIKAGQTALAESREAMPELTES